MEKVIFATIIAVCISISLANLPAKLDNPTFAQYRAECQTETGYDADDSQVFDTPSAKCYVKCFAMKAGIVNDKGEPQCDKVGTVFDIPNGMDIEATMKKCYEDNKNKDDICDRVAGLQKCAIVAIQTFATKS